MRAILGRFGSLALLLLGTLIVLVAFEHGKRLHLFGTDLVSTIVLVVPAPR